MDNLRGRIYGQGRSRHHPLLTCTSLQEKVDMMARLVIAMEERLIELETVNAQAIAEYHNAMRATYEASPQGREERMCAEYLRARYAREEMSRVQSGGALPPPRGPDPPSM